MLNNKIETYLIEFAIFVFVVIKFAFRLSFGYADVLFWALIALFVITMNGVPRDKDYLKSDAIKFTIISILSYILIIYIMGIFTGFIRNAYSLSLSNILKNTIPVIMVVLCQEALRHIICKKNTNNLLPILSYTLLLTAYFVSLNYTGYNLLLKKELFLFGALIIVPEMARQSVYSYICYNISIVPSILFSIIFNIIPYVVPIYPDIGNYLNSVIGLIFPCFVFLNMERLIKYNEKNSYEFNRLSALFITIPIICFSIVLIILISGIFSYKIIAIGSNSMNPIYYKGDAVIYKKVNVDTIEKGDVIAYKYNNIVITHRVVNIEYKNGVKYFTTKGDNNEVVDNVLIPETDVCGKVLYIAKYIGYPTLLINDLLD